MVMSFGNKHQIATQNINADMIRGLICIPIIQALLSHLEVIKVALNFKDFYKSKWVSDVELGYGGKEAVRFHSNSFKFFKNLAIISDYNTIGNVPSRRITAK
jgi:hypothetical protein